MMTIAPRSTVGVGNSPQKMNPKEVAQMRALYSNGASRDLTVAEGLDDAILAEGCRDGQKREEERVEDIQRLPIEGHESARPPSA